MVICKHISILYRSEIASLRPIYEHLRRSVTWP